MSWEEVECQGACVNADGHHRFDTYEDLTPERFEEIVLAFRDGKATPIPTGSAERAQVFRAAFRANDAA